jgi:hypothetical protein
VPINWQITWHTKPRCLVPIRQHQPIAVAQRNVGVRPRLRSNALTIEIGGAIVRVEPGVDPAFLSEVIRLLKAAA